MKKILLHIFAVVAFGQLAAQPSFVKDSLDKYIEEGLTYYSIPGLAITIVQNGKVVVQKGYGVTDYKTKQAVDENTLFMIASNSKLFTGTALAHLEYNKKLSLNDKITKYFPNFKLYDATTTQLVTIKDMLGHHLGTKTFQGDFTFWNSNLSRQEIMRRMQFLKPSNDFRASYGYCNSCFLTAGEVIPKVTNMPWEVYVFDSIVSPLQMINTYTLGAGMENLPNVARPHTNNFTGVLQEIPFDRIDNLGPAGSMVSNVKDLSNWLMMQLDSGRFNGKQILPWPVVRKTRDMITPLSSRKNGTTHFNAYGLGVFMNDYYGKQVFSHTGGADGFVTNTCFIPEMNLGISILTNNDNQSFFEYLRMQIIDAYVGATYVNRSKENLAQHVADNQENIDKIFSWKQRVKNSKTPLPLKSFAGEYQNELYGKIKIVANENYLVAIFPNHRNLTATIEYMDNEEWLVTFNQVMFGISTTKFVIEDKKVKSCDIKIADFIEYDPYTFKKVEPGK
jgi:CubicO group peptidase (beta-lactamase class C family)